MNSINATVRCGFEFETGYKRYLAANVSRQDLVNFLDSSFQGIIESSAR